MASRKITDQLFTGGEDTLEENHLRGFKPDVLVSLVELVGEVPEGYTVQHIPWDQDKEPTPEIIGKWKDAVLPALKAGKKVCILDADGSGPSLDLVSVLMSIHEDKLWGVCVQHVHDTCLCQASYTWWPGEKWKQGFTRHWKIAVKPEVQRPSGRRSPALLGPEEASAQTVHSTTKEKPE